MCHKRVVKTVGILNSCGTRALELNMSLKKKQQARTFTFLMLFVTSVLASAVSGQTVSDSDTGTTRSASLFGQALGDAREQQLYGSDLRSRLLESIRRTDEITVAKALPAEYEVVEKGKLVEVGSAQLKPVGETEQAENVEPVKQAAPIAPLEPVELEEVANGSMRTRLMPLSVPGDVQRTFPSSGVGTVSLVDNISSVPEAGGIQQVACESCAVDSYAPQAGHTVYAAEAACRPTVASPCSCGCGSPMQCQSSLGCCGQCGSLCGCDCNRSRLWARFDVLLWNMDGFNTPPLLTQSPAGTPANTAALLGQPTTQVLAGNQEFGDGFRAGGRFQGGFWFDPCRKVGLQGDFFALDGGGESQVFNSDSSPSGTLGRPFFNTATGEQDAQIFGQPGLAEGSVRFTNSSNVISAAPSLRFNLCCCESTGCDQRSNRTDFILGYRYFQFDETFASQEVLNVTDPLFVDGTSFELNDSIRTQNEFHGVEFGLSRMVQQGRWGWELATLFAVGEVQRIVDLDGSTFIDVPGVQQGESPGGFFVGADEIGRFRDNDYAVIPQVRANLSYCLGGNWRVRAGYNFFYLSSAFRPGTFLTSTQDGSQLGLPSSTVARTQRPQVSKSSLLLHGATVGLSYNF